MGPLVFDLACAIAGSCFVSGTEIDFESVRSLLKGYLSFRTLEAKETEVLPEAVKIALVCNCVFRFLTHGNDSYRELYERIQLMNTNSIEIAEKFSDMI